MDIMNILLAVLLMGGMGLIFGLLLIAVDKKFAVQKDEKEEKIRNLLPGANCGACGFPGCDACAAAMAKGESAPDSCPVGGPDVEAKIREILGLAAAPAAAPAPAPAVPKPAAAPAAEVKPAAAPATSAEPVAKPAAKPHRVAEIDPELCVGCTMCKRNCKFEAITGEVKQKHTIDPEKCKGCGLCASKCPRKAITIKNPDGSIWTPPAPKPAAPAAN